MAPSIVDTFTGADGTLLAAHAPDVGGAWEAMAFGMFGAAPPSTIGIVSNTLRGATTTDSGGPVHRNAADPGADEYDIDVTMTFHTTAQSQRRHAVYWRMTPTGTANLGVDRYYVFGDGTTSQTWELHKSVGGVDTLLGSFPMALVGTTKAVHVEVRTGGMEVFVDGVSILTSSDTTITQRGRVGICTARGGSAHFVDNLAVEPFGVAPEPPPTPANLHLVSRTSGSITVGWDAVTGTEYVLERERWFGEGCGP